MLALYRKSMEEQGYHITANDMAYGNRNVLSQWSCQVLLARLDYRMPDGFVSIARYQLRDVVLSIALFLPESPRPTTQFVRIPSL